MSCSTSSRSDTPDEPSQISDITVEVQPDELKSEELLGHYNHGGFHPISLGDSLDDRYRIHCKLGFGVYSTVWLAEDEYEGEYVSIKVMQAGFIWDRTELDIMLYLNDYDRSHPGYQNVMRLKGWFIQTGPNGDHLCLVMPLMACDLGRLQRTNPEYTSKSETLRQTARQVLLGLQYTHDAGILHLDIKELNILVELPDTDERVRQHLDSIRPHHYRPYKNKDGITIKYVSSTPLLLPSLLEDSDIQFNLRISDFGVGCFMFDKAYYWTKFPLPIYLRPPELFVDAGWDSKLDIWCVGHLLFKLAVGSIILDITSDTSIDDQMSEVLRMFGPVPDQLLDRGENGDRYRERNDEEADLLKKYGMSASWSRMIQKYASSLNADDKALFVSFLCLLLALDPEERLSAKNLLKHGWVRSPYCIRRSGRMLSE